MFHFLSLNEYFDTLFSGFFNQHIESVLKSLVIFAWAYFLGRIVHLFVAFLYRRYDITKQDNLRQRKLRTQLIYIEKLGLLAIWIVAIALFLQNFDELQK